MKSKTFGKSAATISRDAGAAKAGNYLGYNELKSARVGKVSGESGGVAGVTPPQSLSCAQIHPVATRMPVGGLTAEDIGFLRRHAVLLSEATVQVNSILKRIGLGGTAKRQTAPCNSATPIEVLTPAQFAARFHRSPSFGYRQIYCGRVRTIPGMRHSIPVGEVARFAATANIYSGRSNKKKKSKGTPKQCPAQSPIHPSRKEQ